MIRLALSVEGVVQGVGFRPFVHRTATARGLAGWVRNHSDGIHLEVEGPADAVRDFVETLRREPPSAARIERVHTTALPPARAHGFRILASVRDTTTRPTLPSDLATCSDCAAEIETPAARRYRYPFTNCTRCGPRFSVIEALPYDRARTAMRRFPLCAACGAEYADPTDRRFHAEPIACPACGPTLALFGPDGVVVAHGARALEQATEALVAGRIVAVKGLGGFQLLVDATDTAAVARLRARKERPHKPLAVMVASMTEARRIAVLTAAEEHLLTSPAAPIVLVRRRLRPASSAPGTQTVADGVAPRSPLLGVLLPTTPLHRLLTAATARPLVCTSGNLSEEPLCTDNGEARIRLGTVADLFLVHDRPIVRPVDDSVARVGSAGPEVLRRARGFAPLPLRLSGPGETPCVLALGAQLKSTIALVVDGQAVVSQHLGDLHDAAGTLLLERTVADLLRCFDTTPERIACDLHPDYASTRLAERLAAAWSVPLERVQHHHAHVAACMAEHGLTGPLLGLAWDGVGLGTDGRLWGGEALIVTGAAFRRVAHLRPFRLPGGERALREPRRAALGLLYAALGPEAAAQLGSMFNVTEMRVLLTALAQGLNAPETTAVGRLFDAVAALAGLRTHATFEGQAAIELEHAADGADGDAYPFLLGGGDPAVADWTPLLHALLADRAAQVPPAVIARRFHAALVDLATAIAERVGLPDVVLAGGCFQNLRLATGVRRSLAARGCAVHTPALYPPNDGGIALGQALVALRRAEDA